MSITTKTALAASLVAGAATFVLVTVTAASAPGARHTVRATLVATVAGADRPLDAVPDPAGRAIYFTTTGRDGPGIFRVPAGGGPTRRILHGAPLVDPVGLAVSSDGRRLFVADPGAGRILVVPVGGRTVSGLAGSAGTAPRGLDVGARRIVFTGRDPATGRMGVFALPAGGARRATVIAEGGPLRQPQSVAVTPGGAIYLTDRGAGGPRDGEVVRIAGGRTTRLAGGIRLGDPAGIALTRDGSRLFVSSLAAAAGTAQVLLLDTRTLAAGVFNDTIGQNHAAGGLHRGLATAAMAWADVSRSGRVYRVDP